MGRPPLEKKQRQLAVALPPETRSHLEEAAAAAGHSLAEEIRRRLTFTIVDQPTHDLLAAVKVLTGLFQIDVGHDWHVTLKGRQTLARAIQEILESGAPKHGSLAVEELFGPLDPPTAAHMLVRRYRQFLKTQEQTDREIRRLNDEGSKS
jgi:hypothetical protein